MIESGIEEHLKDPPGNQKVNIMHTLHPTKSASNVALFVDLSKESDPFRDINQQTREILIHHNEFSLCDVASLKEASKFLEPGSPCQISVIILWLNATHCDDWKKALSMFKEKKQKTDLIVIFGFTEGVEKPAQQVIISGYHAFSCPFNPDILTAYIKAKNSSVQSSRRLDSIKKRLWNLNLSFKDITKIILDDLEENKFVGYHRATIELIDLETKNCHLVEHKNYTLPERKLQQNIDKDPLIQRVCQEGVYIISNIERPLKDQDAHRLAALGWKDAVSTQDICSWAGIALEYKGETIGLIFLDHQEPNHYGEHGDITRHYLDVFRRIVGEVIGSYFQKRNDRVFMQATQAVSEALQGRTLLHTMLFNIRTGINADNCTFFRAESAIDNKDAYARAWISANDPSNSQEPVNGRIFRKDEGLVGKVLADGKSRIVPHALEHPEFRATPSLSGTDLSMLLVPMFAPKSTGGQSQIIGVISAYVRNHTDAFNPYDRALVELIARQIAPTIYRTLILENIDGLSDKINKSLFNGDRATILNDICEHVLKSTTATEVVIHRFQMDQDNSLQPKITASFWYPLNSSNAPPRLNGKGATDAVLSTGHMIQFSEEDNNSEYIPPTLINRGVKYVLGTPLFLHEGDNNQIIGVLFLNKYMSGQFTEMEKFAVHLFANQAAKTMHTLDKLLELQFLSHGNSTMIEAIRTINGLESHDSILYNTALHAFKLVKADLSCVALYGTKDDLKIHNSYPTHLEEILRRPGVVSNRNNQDHANKRMSEPIFILNTSINTGSSEQNTRRPYIDSGLNSQSVLEVPITVEEQPIGILHLEHKSPNFFTQYHLNAVNTFAQQAGVALQKKTLLIKHQEQNQRLATLLNKLQIIMCSNVQDMLPQAVTLTADAIHAQKVIWIPFRENKNNPAEPSALESEPATKSQIKIDYKKSVSNVPRSQWPNFKNLDETIRMVFTTKEASPITEKSSRISLILPLMSIQTCIGVIWFEFDNIKHDICLDEKTIFIYQAYVNQIALAYQNAQNYLYLQDRLKKSQTESKELMKKHCDEVRLQSLIYFFLALCSSAVGAVLVLYSGWMFFSGSIIGKMWDNTVWAGVGVITEAVGIFVYTQARAAHERMDRYHQEIYRLHQFDTLLFAAEQMSDEARAAAQSDIIKGALGRWLEPRP